MHLLARTSHSRAIFGLVRIFHEARCAALVAITLAVVPAHIRADPATIKQPQIISDDLDHPVAIVPDPRSSAHILIGERSGRVVSFDAKTKKISEVVDIEDLVGSASPRGLLSIATNRAAKDGQLFVSYLDPQGDLVVGRFPLSTTTAPMTEESMAVVIKIARLSVSALGSSMALSPDGLLYIATYDGEGSATSRTHTAQLPKTLLGKVIRIRPGEKSGYSIPPDNPFVRQPNFHPEVWALGFRSPEALNVSEDAKQIIALDTNTRNLEVNLVEAGKNYGWDTVEGTECRESGCSLDSFTNPIVLLPKAGPNSRLVGGLSYTGERHPELTDSIIFAENTSGTVYSARQGGTGWTHTAVTRIGGGSVTALGINATGDIYLATERGELLVMQP